MSQCSALNTVVADIPTSRVSSAQREIALSSLFPKFGHKEPNATEIGPQPLFVAGIKVKVNDKRDHSHAIEVAGLVIALAALVGAFMVPEVRTVIGLGASDSDDSATSPSVPGHTKSILPGSEDDGHGLYLTDIDCYRDSDSVRVYAKILQLGTSNGRITYRIGKKWTTDQIYNDSTEESRNFQVTGVHYNRPVKCSVDLQAQNPTYEQTVETMSN